MSVSTVQKAMPARSGTQTAAGPTGDDPDNDVVEVRAMRGLGGIQKSRNHERHGAQGHDSSDI